MGISLVAGSVDTHNLSRDELYVVTLEKPINPVYAELSFS
jgi:hypothetical protein